MISFKIFNQGGKILKSDLPNLFWKDVEGRSWLNLLEQFIYTYCFEIYEHFAIVDSANLILLWGQACINLNLVTNVNNININNKKSGTGKEKFIKLNSDICDKVAKNICSSWFSWRIPSLATHWWVIMEMLSCNTIRFTQVQSIAIRFIILSKFSFTFVLQSNASKNGLDCCIFQKIWI